MIYVALIYKGLSHCYDELSYLLDMCRTRFLFHCNRVVYNSYSTHGVPYVMVARNAKGISIGKNFSMNNGLTNNPIGCPQKCTLWCGNEASIVIGENVGISQTALISYCEIIIGDNVKIGGGTCIYTTDFHSLDPLIRATKDDQKYRKYAPVHIEENVFIGARCIILKGVTIGKNSIVGAGSVVTKNIPCNQIWGGNPAKFIRNI